MERQEFKLEPGYNHRVLETAFPLSECDFEEGERNIYRIKLKINTERDRVLDLHNEPTSGFVNGVRRVARAVITQEVN